MKEQMGSVYRLQFHARQWLDGKLYALRHRWEEARTNVPWDPKQVLIVLTGLMGDTVMCTPVITELKRIRPDVEITLLGKRHNLELLAACPLVHSFKMSSVDPYTIIRRRDLRQLSLWLKEMEFDAAIILLGDQIARLLAEAAIPIRVGVQGHPLTRCLTHAYAIASPREWGPSERLNALRVLGLPVKETRPSLWISEAARIRAAAKLGELGLPSEEPYAAIHPFGSTPRQWWPVSRLQELVRELYSRFGIKSLLIGERPAAPYGLEPCPGLVDSTGHFSISELLAVLDSAALVISTDSGPFHIAGALGKPLVGLFRSRRPEHARRYKSSVVFGKDECCERQCRWDHCRTDPCRQMSEISVARVVDAVERVWVSEVCHDSRPAVR